VAESREPLRQALTVLRQIGARTWAEQAQTELRAAGDRQTISASVSPDLLSPQELQIAGMAAQGLVEPRDRSAALLVTAYRRLAPVPDLPQARDHVTPSARRDAVEALTSLDPGCRRRRDRATADMGARDVGRVVRPCQWVGTSARHS
jgi:hypothetical protein